MLRKLKEPDIIHGLTTPVSASLQPVLGKMQRRPALLDRQLAHDLKNLRGDDDPFTVTVGKTMCTYDFYEGERLKARDTRERSEANLLHCGTIR